MTKLENKTPGKTSIFIALQIREELKSHHSNENKCKIVITLKFLVQKSPKLGKINDLEKGYYMHSTANLEELKIFPCAIFLNRVALSM